VFRELYVLLHQHLTFKNLTDTKMFTYKLQFDNGKKYRLQAKSMTEAQAKVVKHIESNELTECFITWGGVKTLVRKTGAWHPIHKGFIFTR
jgi:hypothetical protein